MIVSNRNNNDPTNRYAAGTSLRFAVPRLAASARMQSLASRRQTSVSAVQKSAGALRPPLGLRQPRPDPGSTMSDLESTVRLFEAKVWVFKAKPWVITADALYRRGWNLPPWCKTLPLRGNGLGL